MKPVKRIEIIVDSLDVKDLLSELESLVTHLGHFVGFIALVVITVIAINIQSWSLTSIVTSLMPIAVTVIFVSVITRTPLLQPGRSSPGRIVIPSGDIVHPVSYGITLLSKQLNKLFMLLCNLSLHRLTKLRVHFRYDWLGNTVNSPDPQWCNVSAGVLACLVILAITLIEFS